MILKPQLSDWLIIKYMLVFVFICFNLLLTIVNVIYCFQVLLLINFKIMYF